MYILIVITAQSRAITRLAPFAAAEDGRTTPLQINVPSCAPDVEPMMPPLPSGFIKHQDVFPNFDQAHANF
ncbi:MAG: hypothetical protein ACJAY2_000586 [Pseudomonadales bacterium]